MQNAAEFHHAGAVNNSCGMPPVDHHPVIINTLPFLANFYKFWGWCIYFYNKCGYWVIISKKLELEFGLVYKIWKITYLILILLIKIYKKKLIHLEWFNYEKKKNYIVILCYILVYTLYKLYNPFPLNKKDFYKKIMVKKVWDGSYIIFCTKMVQYHEH